MGGAASITGGVRRLPLPSLVRMVRAAVAAGCVFPLPFLTNRTATAGAAPGAGFGCRRRRRPRCRS